MQPRGKFASEHLVHGTGSRNPALTRKSGRHDPDVVMRLPSGGGAGMAGVTRAVVGDLQYSGGEGGGEFGAEPVLTILHSCVIGRLPVVANGTLAPPA